MLSAVAVLTLNHPDDDEAATSKPTRSSRNFVAGAGDRIGVFASPLLPALLSCSRKSMVAPEVDMPPG